MDTFFWTTMGDFLLPGLGTAFSFGFSIFKLFGSIFGG